MTKVEKLGHLCPMDTFLFFSCQTLISCHCFINKEDKILLRNSETKKPTPFACFNFSHSPMVDFDMPGASNGGGADCGYEAMDTSSSSSLPKRSQSSAISTKPHKQNAMPINQRPKHIL